MAADDAEVELRLPGDIFGGDPAGLIRHLGLEGRHIADDRWAVRTPAGGGQHDLLNWYLLADESGREYRFDLLEHVPEAATVPDADTMGRANEVRARLVERATGGSGDIAALFHLIQLDVILAKREDVNQVVEDYYAGIGAMSLESTGQAAFTNRSAHLVRVSDVLIRRVRLPGIMFRFDQDPDAKTTLAAAREGRSGAELYFSSSVDWYGNVIGMSHYLGPLLGSLTPRFWCLPTNRELSVILLSVGMDINGFRAEPIELMQLLPVPGPVDRTLPELRLQRTSCADAIDWWVMRLNQMFGYLSEPTTFRDSNGLYAAHEHHHWMLTFDHIFGLMTSLQHAGRDLVAQRALMNDLLGAFADRIMPIGTEFDDLCSWSKAKEKAEEVRTAMPDSVAALLMPTIDRALDALAQVQDGFFIQRQRGVEDVELRLPDGSPHNLPPERAAARLLKIFRNATHGYGHRRGARKKNEIDASLLVHHDGKLPTDVVLLPYLYLLDTLCHPDRIRQDIARKARCLT